MTLVILYISCFLLSVLLTGLIRRYALASNIMDIPNARSSHSLPTPQSGGLAFVAVFLSSLLFLCFQGKTSKAQMIACTGAGLLVALSGFIDDRIDLAAKWRLLSHFLAAGFALYILGGLAPLHLLGWVLPSGVILNALGLFYLVWLLNLFNFMDGIDGLAALEAMIVCLGACVIYALHANYSSMLLLLALVMATGGFLVWNFPVAKIFMGDIGSGFLGIIIGLLSLSSSGRDQACFWSWLILLGVFIVDASLTLARRALSGQCFWLAHRTHAYQQAAKYYGNHPAVTLRVLLINIFWLLPLAVLASYSVFYGVIVLIIAYIPLIWVALKFNAGISTI